MIILIPLPASGSTWSVSLFIISPVFHTDNQSITMSPYCLFNPSSPDFRISVCNYLSQPFHIHTRIKICIWYPDSKLNIHFTYCPQVLHVMSSVVFVSFEFLFLPLLYSSSLGGFIDIAMWYKICALCCSSRDGLFFIFSYHYISARENERVFIYEVVLVTCSMCS